MSKLTLLGALGALLLASAVPGTIPQAVHATVPQHRNGCHRWHSCPPDTPGAYVCGDLGYYTYCPSKQPTAVPVVPPSGPGHAYIVRIPGAVVTYTGPYEPDHGARTYLYTVRWAAHPLRRSIYEVWTGAPSSGVAELINGANYRGALAMPGGQMYYTKHDRGLWAVGATIPGTCTVQAGYYRGRNAMEMVIHAATCSDALTASGPLVVAVARAIF